MGKVSKDSPSPSSYRLRGSQISVDSGAVSDDLRREVGTAALCGANALTEAIAARVATKTAFMVDVEKSRWAFSLRDGDAS